MKTLIVALLVALTCVATAQNVLQFTPNQPSAVFLTDEPVQYRLAGTAAQYRWEVLDLNGKPVMNGSTGVRDNSGFLSIPIRARGYYTLRLNSTGANPPIERITSFGIVSRFDSARYPDSPFGAMTHFAQQWNPDLIPLIARAGVSTVRDELYWDAVETQVGQFAFPATYDTYMSALAARGIQPLIALTFANRNYDGGLTPHTEAGFAGYARYAQEVLKKYGTQIRSVEIWNEYNGSFATGPAATRRPETYTQMLKQANAAVKQARPDVRVIGGSTIGVPLPYFDRIFQNGGLAAMDAISVHPYRYTATPEGIEGDIASLDELVKRYNGGKSKPVWVTEIGWYTKSSAAPGDPEITEVDQARFLVRGYALLLSAGVEKIYWYLMRDYAEFATMGLVRSDTDARGRYTPKPAYIAFANLARQLAGAKITAREPIGEGLYSIHFRGPAGDVRVMWSLEPRRLDVGAAAPIRVADLVGQEQTLTPDETGNLKLTLNDSPIFVVGAIRPPAVVGDRPQPLVLTDSQRDFSGQQGGKGWSYGVYAPPSEDGADRFRPMPTYRTNHWRSEWADGAPFATISANAQHPGVQGSVPAPVVRRWTSPTAATVRISGLASRGTAGDGSNVHIFVDGKSVFSKQLGGGQSVSEKIDLLVTLRADSRIDFAVDPGPAAEVSYDETRLQVTITRHD